MMNTPCRYDMSSNRWLYESRVPRKAPYNSSFGFVVLAGELYVVTHLCVVDFSETRRSRQQKRAGTLFIQIYDPKNKAWRSLVSKSPFNYPIDINSAVLSSICLWIMLHPSYLYSIRITAKFLLHHIIWSTQLPSW